MVSLCFLSFRTSVCTAKWASVINILKKYMNVGYSNRQLVAIAAILNKIFPPLGFWGLCTRILSGHPSNFPRHFSFLHFFQVGMIFELMLPDYTLDVVVFEYEPFVKPPHIEIIVREMPVAHTVYWHTKTYFHYCWRRSPKRNSVTA